MTKNPYQYISSISEWNLGIRSTTLFTDTSNVRGMGRFPIINAQVDYRTQSEDNPNIRQTLISLSQILPGIQTKLLDIGILDFNSFQFKHY